MSILIRAFSRGVFVGGLLAGQVMLAAETVAATDDYERLKKPIAVKPFSLLDQNGAPFNLQSLKNHWSMIFVGFTTCPDVCPVTLGNLEAVRAEMGLRVSPERIPRIIFLAVDPARDVPVLKEYLGYDSILGDTVEALIGAVYLDRGIEAAREIVTAWFKSFFDSALQAQPVKDAKTALQEWLQHGNKPLPDYQLVSTGGEAHSRLFTVSCKIAAVETAMTATASSRRRAEQMVAEQLLEEVEKSK